MPDAVDFSDIPGTPAQSGETTTAAGQLKRGRRLELARKRKLLLTLAAYALATLALVVVLLMNFRNPPLRAAWLWNPANYAAQPEQLLNTAQDWKLTHLFIQVGLQPDGKLANQEAFQQLLPHLQRHGISIYALAGDPAWAVEGQQKEPLDVIRAVADYNKRNSPGFESIQFDVEPYLLPRFVLQPEEVYRQYLSFVETSSSFAHRNGLSVGYAIPFFMDQTVKFHNEAAPVYQHVMQRSEHLALMAYRTSLTGEDGLTSLSRQVRAYRDVQDSVADVWLGVETTSGTANWVRFLTAVQAPEAPAELRIDWHGHRVRLHHVGRTFLLGLVGSSADAASITSAPLVAIAEQTKFPTTAEAEVLAAAERELRETGEYSDIRRVPLGTAYGKDVIALEAREQVPARITFSGQPSSELLRYIKQVERKLVNGDGVRGVAIHDFDTLVARSKQHNSQD